MTKLTTHQMATQFGVTPRTLRHYDAIGLLHPERRGPHRLFGPQEQGAMYAIEHGKAIGLSLEEIKAFMAPDRKSLKVPPHVLDRLAFEAEAARQSATWAMAKIDVMRGAAA